MWLKSLLTKTQTKHNQICNLLYYFSSSGKCRHLSVSDKSSQMKSGEEGHVGFNMRNPDSHVGSPWQKKLISAAEIFLFLPWTNFAGLDFFMMSFLHQVECGYFRRVQQNDFYLLHLTGRKSINLLSSLNFTFWLVVKNIICGPMRVDLRLLFDLRSHSSFTTNTRGSCVSRKTCWDSRLLPDPGLPALSCPPPDSPIVV